VIRWWRAKEPLAIEGSSARQADWEVLGRVFVERGPSQRLPDDVWYVITIVKLMSASTSGEHRPAGTSGYMASCTYQTLPSPLR
jgi:hypothetical protein